MVERFLPIAFTQFLLRQVVLFDKMLVGQCDLHRIQVFALDVLHQGHFHDILVICRTYVCRDGVQAGLFGSSPAPFSGDNLKRVVFHLAECDGLYDADFRNGVGQLAQTFRVKSLLGWLGFGEILSSSISLMVEEPSV